ncbi:hypothetical protein ThidrDRAFT_2640 [Thiorhodococcus drewsii AZ1]|uniref:Uncharacterized protein n=1 Tax=Thiorhodococcus drewsii AZ1 TaxID=765913 RepID=G2E2X7_9GAMM|nr:hypothetical protein [Thiorhodococcus drewsii]EGV30439.1 hypothetical protein ThidrDRAFT_2640 [Thiorhodococcus drewsii AZ1]
MPRLAQSLDLVIDHIQRQRRVETVEPDIFWISATQFRERRRACIVAD